MIENSCCLYIVANDNSKFRFVGRSFILASKYTQMTRKGAQKQENYILQDMKSETSPTFITSTSNNNKHIDSASFLSYLATVHQPQIIQNNYKNLYEHILMLTKSQHYISHAIPLLQILSSFFKSSPIPQLLTLMRLVISPDIKYEAKNQLTSDVMHAEQNIRASVPNSDEAIALPYEPVYGPAAPPIIALCNETMSDVYDQKKQGQAQLLYKDDNERATEYLIEPFKVVKRQGITEIFKRLTQIICTELMQEFIHKQFMNLPPNSLLQLLRILEYINQPIYTFYLMTITANIAERLLFLFEQKQTEKRYSKDQIQGLVATFNNITERCSESSETNREGFQWQMDKRIIALLIKSQISQKKLHSVKMMCEICRKSNYYSLKISEDQIRQFITNSNLLEEIYRADNHPEIIAKGQEVYQFMTKPNLLTHSLINLIFSLLEKCHQNVSKSLFSTLISTGQTNLQDNRQYLLKKISQLPRANCFNEQTFILIESLMVITPAESIEASLYVLYEIIHKNYNKMKQNLKSKIITIYFEVFIMGIQSQIFNNQNSINALKPVLINPSSHLFLLMIEHFVQKLKEQFSKQVGIKCKKVLNKTIKTLMTQEKIHRLQLEDSQKHLKILKLLLESYEQLDLLLSQEQLWELIKVDRKFSKFVQHYPQTIQLQMISTLLSMDNKSPNDLESLLDLYQLVNRKVKEDLVPLIVSEYHKTQKIIDKYILAPLVLKLSPLTLEDILNQVEEHQDNAEQSLSWLVLARQIILKEDQKGYGEYPPYEFIKNSYEVTIKVSNYFNLYDPSPPLQIKVKSYTTLFQIIKQILLIVNVSFQKVKIRLNDQFTYLSLNELKQKICNVSPLKNVSLDIYQTAECEWYDKQKIFDKDGSMNSQVITMLKQIYHSFASKNNKLRPNQTAKIFAKATGVQSIQQNDTRILYIFNNYSNSGDHLTLDEWINYYYQSSLKNAPLVIDNLRHLGYQQYFKGDQQFDKLLEEENKLRRFLVKDGRIFNMIFKIYTNFAGDKSEHKNIIGELHSMLKLLPASLSIISLIQQNKTEIFQYQNANNLYYWYITSILQSAYTNNIKMDNHSKWKDQFLHSQNYSKFAALYQTYLMTILHLHPESIHINNSIQIFILQNLSTVIRENMKIIPSLLTASNELAPLLLSNFQLELRANSTKHHQNHLSDHLAQLGHLCIAIVKGKRDQQMAESVVALAAMLIIYQVKRYPSSVLRLQVIYELVFHPNAIVRQIFNSFYFILSEIVGSIKISYYSIPLQRNKKQSFKHCKEYFVILSKFLFVEDNDKFYTTIFNAYQSNLLQKEQTSNKENEVQPDQILLGKLKIMNEIKLCNPEALIEQSTITNIKHLLQTSPFQQQRDILYSMSGNICGNLYNLSLMAQIMKNIHLSRNSLSRGDKKMGIMNLGCICYINSVLQQLQMIIPFRKGIIIAEVPENEIDFFGQFQYLIAQLTFGQRSFIIPQTFCLSYVDNNNNPINVKQQHDADEFLNQLLDRLQIRLKATNERELIGNNFRGEMSNIISCEKCYHIKQRIQNFYILTVEIKNQNNLKDCLNKLIEPEIICDYYCEYCEAKVETIQKYHRFQTLPPFLFIHLQRLVFDLETFNKIKLDHPLEFPTEINLQPYFNHQKTEEETVYVLKGFVVHQGNSQGGHYYSLIKCKDAWTKFDDTRIDSWDWNTGSYDRDHAYLLLYERKTKKETINDEQVYKKQNPVVMQAVNSDNANLLKERIFLQSSFTRFLLDTIKRIPVPDKFITNSIIDLAIPYQHNFQEVPEELQKELDLAFQVILQYLKLQSDTRQMNLLRGQTEMRDNNESHLVLSHQLQKIVAFLVFILHLRPQQAFPTLDHFIEEGDQNIFKNIYLHQQKIMRLSYKLILMKVLSITSSSIVTSFLLPVPHNQKITKMLKIIMNALGEVGKNSNKMDEFFQLIFTLCMMDRRFIEWFQCNKLGPKLIHFIMQKQSNMEELLPSYPLFLNSTHRTDSISLMIEIINQLIVYQPDLSLEREQTKLQRKAYQNVEFYKRLLHDRYQNECLTNLVNYSVKNNPQFNNKLLDLIIENINRFSHEDKYIYIYIHILYGLLNIEDELTNNRLQRLLGVPVVIKSQDSAFDQSMITKVTERICKYWNPMMKPGDQIIFSLLEILYINRHNLNYFTYLAIVCLLKLTAHNKNVAQYINQLPGPCPAFRRYINWINNEFLYNLNKAKPESNHRDVPFQQRKALIEKIVQFMRQVQISEQKQQNSERELSINTANSLYTIGKILYSSDWNSMFFILAENLFLADAMEPVDQINIEKEVVSVKYRIIYALDQTLQTERPKAIQYQIEVQQKSQIFFIQSYQYTFVLSQGSYELILPFYQHQIDNFRIRLLEPITKKEVPHHPKIATTIQPMEIEQYHTEAKLPNDQRLQEEFPAIDDVYGQRAGYDNNLNGGRDTQNYFECPFCNYTTPNFANRCKQCGEDWGQMM